MKSTMETLGAPWKSQTSRLRPVLSAAGRLDALADEEDGVYGGMLAPPVTRLPWAAVDQRTR